MQICLQVLDENKTFVSVNSFQELIRILNEYLISLNHDFKDVRTTSRICNIFNVKY
jgi:hypothetical protein